MGRKNIYVNEVYNLFDGNQNLEQLVENYVNNISSSSKLTTLKVKTSKEELQHLIQFLKASPHLGTIMYLRTELMRFRTENKKKNRTKIKLQTQPKKKYYIKKKPKGIWLYDIDTMDILMFPSIKDAAYRFNCQYYTIASAKRKVGLLFNKYAVVDEGQPFPNSLFKWELEVIATGIKKQYVTVHQAAKAHKFSADAAMVAAARGKPFNKKRFFLKKISNK